MGRYKVYAAGNMTPNPEIYYTWVEDLKNGLGGHPFHVSTSHYKEVGMNKFIVRHDLARLTHCHAVVVNLGVTDLEHHLTGAVCEVYEAYRQGKPVYAFTSSGTKRSQQADSAWMQEFITHEFESLEDLIEFLVVEDNLPVYN